MFPDHAEQQKKLALLGIAGGLGNVLGLLIAGVAMLHSYKAFFWIIAGICVVFVSHLTPSRLSSTNISSPVSP
jgi:MFS family permease